MFTLTEKEFKVLKENEVKYVLDDWGRFVNVYLTSRLGFKYMLEVDCDESFTKGFLEEADEFDPDAKVLSLLKEGIESKKGRTAPYHSAPALVADTYEIYDRLKKISDELMGKEHQSSSSIVSIIDSMANAFGDMAYMAEQNLPDDPEEYEYDRECLDTYDRSRKEFNRSYDKLLEFFAEEEPGLDDSEDVA